MKKLAAILFHALVTWVLFPYPTCQAQPMFRIDGIYQLSYLQPIPAEVTSVFQMDVSYYCHPDSPMVFTNLFVSPGFSSPDYWVFKNLELEPFPDTVHLTIEMDLSQYFPVPDTPLAFTPMLCGFAYTSMPWDSVPLSGVINHVPETVGKREIAIGNQLPDGAATSGITIPANPNTSLPPQVWQGDSSRGVIVGCNMINMDLNDSIYNSLDVPDYAGDANACGPVATTNSFSWLRGQHSVIDSLLNPHFGKGDTTLRKMLKDFSQLMGRDTSAFGLTRIHEFILGKLDFIDKYKLPVHVKYQSISSNINNIDSVPSSQVATTGHSARNQNAPFDPNNPYGRITFDWMFNEMAHGEDVEPFLLWMKKNPAGVYEPNFGHYVVLTGLRETGGVKRLKFKDDDDQLREGGLRHKIATMREDTVLLRGAYYLPELSNDSLGRCYIKDVVSESYDSTITYPVGIREVQPEHNYRIDLAPNPASHYLYLTTKGVNENAKVSLFDITGRIIYTWEISAGDNSPHHTLQLPAALPDGWYLLNIKGSSLNWTNRIDVQQH